MEREQPLLPCPKITREQTVLTPQQVAYVRQFAQEHLAAMLSTHPIDEAEAEEHLRAAYRVAGLEPVPVRWFDSPLAFCQTSFEDFLWKRLDETVLFIERDSIKDSICSNILLNDGVPIEDNIWDSVVDIVQGSIHGVCDSIWSCVWGSVNDSVWKGAWADTLYNLLPGTVDSVWHYVDNSVWGYYHQDWQSLCQFFHEVFEENNLIHLARLNEMVSGYRLGSKEAWVVRKPMRLDLDEQGRLHSADGMCMQYRDGWGFYAWHGVDLPAQVILHPEQLTREDWLQEVNVEIRRAIQEQLGSDRFIALVGGTCIDRSQRGELIAVDLKNDPERVAHYVHVQDASTARQYYLRVPPSIRRVDEAVAWTFGLSEQEYQPGQET